MGLSFEQYYTVVSSKKTARVIENSFSHAIEISDIMSSIDYYYGNETFHLMFFKTEEEIIFDDFRGITYIDAYTLPGLILIIVDENERFITTEVIFPGKINIAKLRKLLKLIDCTYRTEMKNGKFFLKFGTEWFTYMRLIGNLKYNLKIDHTILVDFHPLNLNE